MRFLVLLGIVFSCSLFAAASPETIRKRMLADLDFIKSSFEVKYAPSLWKKEHAGWHIEKAVREAKLKVHSLRNPTIKDYQIILKELFQSPRDYHVGIIFHSTEQATLPFIVRGADHKYFIVEVDDKTLPLATLQIGDEVLMFNGRPFDEVMQEFKKKEFGDNSEKTDQGLAELLFTFRTGMQGHRVPSGDAAITVRHKNGEEVTVVLKWNYQKEKISDYTSYTRPKQEVNVNTLFGRKELPQKNWKPFFDKMMVSACYAKGLKDRDGGHDIGQRKSFIPALGQKIWEGSEDKFNDAYIFEITDPALLPLEKKKLRVGYVRIPHFMADEDEALEFGKLMALYQSKTDALVIDQVNNPGGSVFYLYALASMLTERPMTAPKHHITLTQEEIQLAHSLLEALEPVNDDCTAKMVFGETVGGYVVDYHFVEATRQFCQFLIAEWEQGRIYSNPIHLFGVDMIRPHPDVQYTKPVLVLVNSLDFSAADFFPAILQDNKRATLLGTRTGGAGGYVIGATYPNLIGVMGFQLTGSYALRENQQPIENLGITPDIPYDLTVKDFQNNYQPYVEKIVSTLCSLCK